MFCETECMEEGELQDLLGELLGLFLRGWADFQFFSIMKNMSIYGNRLKTSHLFVCVKLSFRIFGPLCLSFHVTPTDTYVCYVSCISGLSLKIYVLYIYIYTNPITLPQITAVISRELPISFIQLRFSESPPGRLQTSPRWPLCVVIKFICWDLGIFQGDFEVGIPVDYLRHFPQKRSTTFSREFPRVLGRKLLSPKGSAAHFVHRRRNFGSVDQFSSRCLRKA